jgi:hypothetical protein
MAVIIGERLTADKGITGDRTYRPGGEGSLGSGLSLRDGFPDRQRDLALLLNFDVVAGAGAMLVLA